MLDTVKRNITDAEAREGGLAQHERAIRRKHAADFHRYQICRRRHGICRSCFAAAEKLPAVVTPTKLSIVEAIYGPTIV